MKTRRKTRNLKPLLALFVLSVLAITSMAQAQAPIEIRLTWTDTSDNEDGFRVQRCVGLFCADFHNIGSPVGPNVMTYVDTILNDPGERTICYRVLAFNKAGNSNPSNISCVTTPPLTARSKGPRNLETPIK